MVGCKKDGTFSVEVACFLDVAGVSRSAVREFLADKEWCFAKANGKAKALHRIFDDRRESAANPSRVKATCGELLGVYGLLRHYVECLVLRRAETESARQSFVAVCRVLDLLLDAKFGLASVSSIWAPLEAATAEHLRLHQAAHGDGSVRPKHHWQLDVPRQLARDNLVLDAFVIERTHLAVKAVADPSKTLELLKTVF